MRGKTVFKAIHDSLFVNGRPPHLGLREKICRIIVNFLESP